MWINQKLLKSIKNYIKFILTHKIKKKTEKNRLNKLSRTYFKNFILKYIRNKLIKHNEKLFLKRIRKTLTF